MSNNCHEIENLSKFFNPIFVTINNINVMVMLIEARTIVVSLNLTLRYVLPLCKFSCNLLSIQQLAKDVRCLVSYVEKFLSHIGAHLKEADGSG